MYVCNYVPETRGKIGQNEVHVEQQTQTRVLIGRMSSAKHVDDEIKPKPAHTNPAPVPRLPTRWPTFNSGADFNTEPRPTLSAPHSVQSHLCPPQRNRDSGVNKAISDQGVAILEPC